MVVVTTPEKKRILRKRNRFEVKWKVWPGTTKVCQKLSTAGEICKKRNLIGESKMCWRRREKEIDIYIAPKNKDGLISTPCSMFLFVNFFFWVFSFSFSFDYLCILPTFVFVSSIYTYLIYQQILSHLFSNIFLL